MVVFGGDAVVVATGEIVDATMLAVTSVVVVAGPVVVVGAAVVVGTAVVVDA